MEAVQPFIPPRWYPYTFLAGPKGAERRRNMARLKKVRNRWVLDNMLGAELEELHTLAKDGQLVLLDYSTNDDVSRLDKPLSHAALIRAYLEGAWPEPEVEAPDAARRLEAGGGDALSC